MKTNFRQRPFTIILFVSLLIGCDDYLDVNVDKDLPSSATPNLLLTPIQGLMAINCYEQGETTAYFTQQIATHTGFSSVKDRWDYSTVTREGLFRRHYYDVAGNARNLINTAQDEGSENYEATGHVMMVLSAHTATDLLGDMPYSEALKGNPSPSYDEQSVIYEGMLEEIDLAIDLFEASDETDRFMGPTEDTIYEGDLQLWISFARGLKARLLLHLTPNINQNYQQVIDEVDLALANWKDPEFQYITGSVSPWELNQWGRTRARPDWDYVPNILGESAPTPFMLEQVLGYDPLTLTINDPRMPLMMSPNTLGEYLSIASSEGKETLRDADEYPDLYDTYYTSDDSAQPYMTEEELYFIKAEAAFNNSNKEMAFAAFQQGVELHMQRVGVTPADIADFMASPMVPANATALELSDIMMQKWLALYLQAEVWTDMRRYQYDPKVYKGLNRPKTLAFFWSDDDDTEWIQRLPYDNQTEEIYNKPELERLGAFQNPEWLKVKLWWTGG